MLSQIDGQLIRFNDEELVMIQRSYDIAGHRYTDAGLTEPTIIQNNLLVESELHAELMANCVLYVGQLALNLLDAHDAHQRRIQQRGLPQHCYEQIERIQASRDRCTKQINHAQHISRRLFSTFYADNEK